MKRYNLMSKILIVLLPLDTLLLVILPVYYYLLKGSLLSASQVSLIAFKSFSIITIASVIAFIIYEMYHNRHKVIDSFLLALCVLIIILSTCLPLFDINFGITYLKDSDNVFNTIIVLYTAGIFIYYYYVYDRVLYKKD